MTNELSENRPRLDKTEPHEQQQEALSAWRQQSTTPLRSFAKDLWPPAADMAQVFPQVAR